MGEPIVFQAEVSKIQTLADGGLRFTFDVNEDCACQAVQLMECKRWGQVVEIVVSTDVQRNETKRAR